MIQRYRYCNTESREIGEENNEEPIGAIVTYFGDAWWFAPDEESAARGEWSPWSEETASTSEKAASTRQIPAANTNAAPETAELPAPAVQPPRQWTYSGSFWTEEQSGMMYFPARQGKINNNNNNNNNNKNKWRRETPKPERLLDKDGRAVDNPEILAEIRKIHEKKGAEAFAQETEERKRKKSELDLPSDVKKKRFSVSDYIAGHFDVRSDGEVISFYVKDSDRLAGQISFYRKGNDLSFDLNKFEKQEGEFSGISYLLVYELMRTVGQSGGYQGVQIEAFDSGSGTSGLRALYQRMGFDSGMHGDISEIRDACERLAADKFGAS